LDTNTFLPQGLSEGFAAQDSLFSTMALETFDPEDTEENQIEIKKEEEEELIVGPVDNFTSLDFVANEVNSQELVNVKLENVKAPIIRSESLELINSKLQMMRNELNQLRENLYALIR
jgi:hypothetical protein